MLMKLGLNKERATL